MHSMHEAERSEQGYRSILSSRGMSNLTHGMGNSPMCWDAIMQGHAGMHAPESCLGYVHVAASLQLGELTQSVRALQTGNTPCGQLCIWTDPLKMKLPAC